MMRWLLVALALLLLSSSPREAQQAPREVPCPPKEPNSFCVLRGPLGYHMRPEIAFSPDGQWLAVSWGPWQGEEGDPMIWVWRVADGQLAWKYQAPRIGGVQFSSDGKLLASTEGPAVRIREVGTWKELHTLRFEGLGAIALAFSPSSRVLAVGAVFKFDFPWYHAGVILWDPHKGVEIGRIERAHQAIITDLAFPSEELLVTGGSLYHDPYIRFWQLSTRRLVRSIYVADGVRVIEISPNRKMLATLVRGTLAVWDVASGRELGSIDKPFVGLSFSPDGQFLAGSERYSQQEGRKLLEIWRVKGAVQDWQVARTLQIPVPNPINHFLGSLSFSPDGKILAIRIGGVEESIQLWYVGDLQ